MDFSHLLLDIDIDLVDFLRAGFLLTAAAIFAINQFPFLHGLMLYGARAVENENDQKKKKPDDDNDNDNDNHAVKSFSSSFISRLTSISVPHTYFTHFYLFSCLSSLLWAHQLYTRGPLFLCLARLAQRTGKDVTVSAHASMTPTQLILCWLAMAVQGARRFAECISFFKPSVSRMWIVFYVVGVAFYLLVNIAIWVEGVGTLTTLSSNDTLDFTFHPFLPLSNLFPITAFILASGIQNDCHRYLCSLKKYTLPTEHLAFQYIISPHYTAECAIYLSLAFLAAPQGQLVNRTVLSVAVFVVVILGASAASSKRWYEKKFGGEGVRGRWRMVPGIY